MKTTRTSKLGSSAVILVLVYLAGYLVLRQSAARGTIFLTPTGSGTSIPHDYRGISLNPWVAKWVHRAYSPVIMMDRAWTDTVVTVNIP